MKRKKLIAAGLCAVLGASAAAIPASAADYYNIQERELGNTYIQSTPAALPSSIVGHIDKTAEDVDFYSLPIAQSTALSLRVSILKPGLTSLLRMELYNQSMELIAQANTGYENEFYGMLTIDQPLEAGHYYIKLYATSSATVVNVPYMITVDENLPLETDGMEATALPPAEHGPVSQQDIIQSAIQWAPDLDRNYQWFQHWVEQTGSDTSMIDDPLAPLQYHLPQVNVYNAWKETMGDPEIVVAVIDQGIDTGIFDLSTRSLPVMHIKGAEEYGAVPIDHGNHVSGLINARANNGVGVTGIAPNVTLMPINAWDASGKERTEQSTADAIRYAADNGARVLSMSIGNPNFAPEKSGDSDLIREAIEYAYDKGVVLIACTQNQGGDQPDYPARYPQVIAVGATDGNNDLWVDSNKGGDIVAPGYNIMSLGINGNYLPLSGTSMSTPIVAGAAALILSKNPSLTNDQVRDILLESATDLGQPEVFGHGALNVGKALEMTPAPETKQSKTDALSGKWYQQPVAYLYDQGLYRQQSFEETDLNRDMTKGEWMALLKQYCAIPVPDGEVGSGWTAENLAEPIVRDQAFALLFEAYQYLYGTQNTGAIETLQAKGIVSGRGDAEGLALDRPLTYAEGAQLLYNLRHAL